MTQRPGPGGEAILSRLAASGYVALFSGAFLLLMQAQVLGDSVPRSHGPTTKRIVSLQTEHPPGTILISNSERTLDLVLDRETVARYTVAVGRDGFVWSGTVRVGRKAEWPEWRPPPEMRQRDPRLPEMVPAGPYNPLGARAIYLYRDGRDTLYRIHGTNDAPSIGDFVSAGCFRMTNTDVLELYGQVRVGATVIVR